MNNFQAEDVTELSLLEHASGHAGGDGRRTIFGLRLQPSDARLYSKNIGKVLSYIQIGET